MSSKERRKSDKLSSNIVKLTVPPEKLRAILQSTGATNKHKSTASTPTPFADINVTAPSSPDNKILNNVASVVDDSMPSTPSGYHGALAMDTPGGTPMAPPMAGDSPLKKKGVKRSAAVAGVDGVGSAGPGSVNGDTPAPAPRVRSKPGPKKKAKLDDSMVEIRSGAGGAHKLGPKASMGAINAGLRALDRSGKPCRRWVKRGFQIKTFTGVTWAVPRWKAPSKQAEELLPGGNQLLAALADNKAKSSKASDGVDDVEMSNAPTPSAEPATAAATPGAA